MDVKRLTELFDRELVGNDRVEVDHLLADHVSCLKVIDPSVCCTAGNVEFVVVDNGSVDLAHPALGESCEEADRAALLGKLQDGVDQCIDADRHDDSVDAFSVGLFHDDLLKIFIHGVDDSCSAELCGQFSLACIRLAHEDFFRSGDLGKLKMHKTDRACADYKDCVIESRSGILQTSDAAGKRLDQGACSVADIFRKLDDIAALDADVRDTNVLFETAVELIADGLAVQAGILSSAEAGCAVAAGDNVCDRDLFTLGISFNVLADFCDDTADLMTDDGIFANAFGLSACEDSLVRSAKSCRFHPDDQITVAADRLFNIHHLVIVRIVFRSV